MPNPSPPPSKSLRNLEKGSDEYEAVQKKVNQRAAERLLYVCSKHGGVYTKFGQHVSSMNHILPKEYTETLKVLQDRNPRLVEIFALTEASFFFYLGRLSVFASPILNPSQNSQNRDCKGFRYKEAMNPLLYIYKIPSMGK